MFMIFNFQNCSPQNVPVWSIILSRPTSNDADVGFVVLEQEIWTGNVEIFILQRYRAQGSSSATNINNVLHS